MLTASINFIKNDFLQVRDYLRFAMVKAAIRLQLQYNKTIVGLLWEPLSLLIVTVALCAIWSVVLTESNFFDFFYFVLAGMLIWNFISSIISRGVNVFYVHTVQLKSRYAPLSLPIIEDLVYELYRFILSLLLFLPLFLFHSANLVSMLWFFYGLILMLVSGLGFVFLFGAISFFYQDVKQVILSIMRLAFLLTPIIWRKERLGIYQDFVLLNPFYCYIEICRNGMLGQPTEPRVLIIGTLLTIVIFTLGLFFISSNEKKIRYRGFLN